MKALNIKKLVDDVAQLHFEVVNKPVPVICEGQCLAKVFACGVNPSDVMSVTNGNFQDAMVSRIPGRDFAGVIIEGPGALVGKNVWGTLGAGGIEFDGAMCEYLAMPIDAVAEIPANFDLASASAQVLPYVTAYFALAVHADIQPGARVAIVGALGQVGQAAMSICRWKGASPVALVKGQVDVERAKARGWKVVDTESSGLSECLLAENEGQPIDMVLNTIGNRLWPELMASLADYGQLVTIGAQKGTREISVNLRDLYRRNQRISGVNTVSLDSIYNAKILNEMKAGFEQGELQPLTLDSDHHYTLHNAEQAFQQVAAGSTQRVVIYL